MSEGERSNSSLSEESEAYAEVCNLSQAFKRSEVEDMIGLFTERQPDNLDRRYWVKPLESKQSEKSQKKLLFLDLGKDKSIWYYKSKTHSYEHVKMLLRQIQRNPTITRFNIKLEAYNCILTGLTVTI